MMVLVKAYGTLRDQLGFKGSLRLDLEEGSDLCTLLKLLVKEQGEDIKGHLWKNDELLVKVFINGRDVEFLGGLKTMLKDGDEVALIPPIAGGNA